ncbi:hypothetical protein LSAT2_032115 [Lamellibrachia satsuma]|nr:hypothetical protein LSAT2_032115 [Lamellibrachia satsuma]
MKSAGGDQPSVVRQEAAAMADGISEFLKRQEAMIQSRINRLVTWLLLFNPCKEEVVDSDRMDPGFAGRMGQQIISAATVQQSKQEREETTEQASRIFGKARCRKLHGGI